LNSPFDKAKYEALLKGLEASEVRLSELDRKYIRIDSEYYSKQNLSNNYFFSRMICKNIAEVASVADGDHSKFPDNQLQEIRYLQAKDIRNHFIENDNPVFVGKEYFETQKRSHIHEEYIVLSIMGSVGDIAIIPKGFQPCIANRAVAIIKNIDGINPYYLFAFLSSKKGLQQIDKQKNGGVQQRINLDLLANIKIPILPIPFQREIEKTVKQAHAKREQSQALYREAEALLLESIGFSPQITRINTDTQSVEICGNLWTNINIKTFSQSFGATGRLDAEYYQKKYEAIIALVKNYENGFCKLKDMGNFKNGSLISDKLYVECGKRAYIRIKELSFNAPISDNDVIFIDDTFISTNETTVNTNDFVFATIGATIGKVNIITEKYNNSFISNNTSRFRLKNKTHNYFFYELLLRSFVVQEQIQREFTQTAQPKISNESLENIIIPLVDTAAQERIAGLIQKSFALRQASESLLKEAKAMVEREIEKI
jgi:restriction endonuclease S subunit